MQPGLPPDGRAIEISLEGHDLVAGIGAAGFVEQKLRRQKIGVVGNPGGNRHRRAKHGQTAGIPGHALDPELAVAAAALTAEVVGVVNIPVLATGIGENAVMTRAVRAGLLTEHRAGFGPRGGVHEVGAGEGEQAEAIAVRPATAGGIINVRTTIVAEAKWSFVDCRGCSDRFPRLGWLRYQHRRAAERVGVAHGCDVNVLVAGRVAGKDEIKLAVGGGEDAAVDVPETVEQHATFRVGAGDIGAGALGHVHAFIAGAAGINAVINKPVGVKPVDFRGPEIGAAGGIDDLIRCRDQAADRCRLVQADVAAVTLDQIEKAVAEFHFRVLALHHWNRKGGGADVARQQQDTPKEPASGKRKSRPQDYGILKHGVAVILTKPEQTG